jgi:hypothetical protein
METAAIAEQYQFLSSPTIRVNGRDICQSVVENSCGCCSEISGAKVDCRVFKFNGESYEVPPKEMLADAILYSVFGMSDGGCSCDTGYELLKSEGVFYGKKNVHPAVATMIAVRITGSKRRNEIVGVNNDAH